MGRSEIHIVAGPVAAACLREGMALTSDQVLIHYDLLSCGPLRSLESLEDWRELRQGYLQSLDGEDQSFRFADRARDVLTHCEELRHARTITLWLGTGLADQLMLVWVVALLHKLGISTETCRVIQYNLERAYEVVAVGVLEPAQFKKHPEAVALDDASVRESTAAWEAVTLSGDTKRLRETKVRLTQYGEAVLAGKGNAVEWNGIDDWVAGVHLNSRNGRVWFRREQTLSEAP
jgi:hypothetical protein